jgi:Phage major capsid protein E
MAKISSQSAVWPSGQANFPHSIQELMEYWKLAYPAPSFIRDNLFQTVKTSNAKTLAVDYYKDSMKLAPWVSPISMGRVVNREKYRTHAWDPPPLKPVRTMHPEDMWDRIAGEAFGSPDPQAREATALIEDMQDLDNLIARTEELLCCQCITTGHVTCYSIEGDERLPLAELEYEIEPRVLVSPTWDDGAADPLSDLRVAMRALSARAGAQCDFIVMGSAASDAFETNQHVIDGYDKYWIKPGELRPEERLWGVTVLGSHRGITLHSYGLTYEDDLTGDMIPFMPDNLVLLAARGARSGVLGYAGVWMENDDGHHELFEGTRIWKTYFKDEVRHLRCISKPLPIPFNSKSWLIMQVLP